MTMRRNERGFTLIELMISVAIIGLLSAIAVPSFMTYQARSRQAEAKVNLGGIYVSEATYGAEAGRYADFSTVGYSLAGNSNRYTYRSPNAAGNGGSAGIQGFDLYATGAGSSTVGGIVQVENPIVPSAAVTSAPPQPPAFTATAGGDLDSDATVDYWHVNDVKLGITIADQTDI